ncbi:unnamed protein product [Orchesella dallaii]|uniref:Metalloendopeptidase n=1 Tax=Orchesella dallaii TaxID=48710 RepID=A0ABP1S372_9HEXA
MIRLAPLPFQQQSHHHHHHQRHQEHRRSLVFIVVTVGFVLLCVISNFSVSGEGPSCNQVGHGPEDIIMASGRINPKYTWYKRGHKTYVPIVMDPTYSYKEHSTIIGGLNEIQEKTCVEFELYDDEASLHGKDYVYITRTTKRGCWSYIGRIGRGKQEMGLPPGCITHRTAMHEMMHALGFRHEHVRHDRDDYIIIFWGNIRTGRESNFQKRGTDTSVGPYDYDSIMHYEKKAFSNNGADTIRPLKNGVKIGVRQKMSYWDAKKINIMYGCSAGGGGGGHLSWTPEHDDHHDDVLSPVPRNASSSPSSSEIEVAYDELDYDPGLTPSAGSGRGGFHRQRNDEHPDDHDHHHPASFDHHHNQDDEHPHSHQQRDPSGHQHQHLDEDDNHHHPHRSGYLQSRHQNQYPHHDPGQNHFHSNEDDRSNGFVHNQPHQQNVPQSYSHFTLDTYPTTGGSHPAQNDESNNAGNEEFYDF